MTHENYQTVTRRSELSIESLDRTYKHNSIKPYKKLVIYVSTLLVWGGLIYVGYLHSIDYIEKSQQQIIIEIKQANDEAIQNINTELQLFQQEINNVSSDLSYVAEQLGFIQDELQLTGETIIGSDRTRQALTDRITDLDRQLAELRIQLIRLEEAARVY